MQIIEIRKGTNGFRYSICDNQGYWLSNILNISDATKLYKWAIKNHEIILVRNLSALPDLSIHKKTQENLIHILKSFKR